MKRISILIIVLSILSIFYSFTIPAYIDENNYKQQYLVIDLRELDRRNAFNKFYDLREKYLSSKYRLQDYGATFLILGFSILAFFGKSLPIKAPTSKVRIALVGVTAAVLTIIGYIGDLFLEFYRGSYPWWADSIGIALMDVPILTGIFLGWVVLNIFAMNSEFNLGASISLKNIKNSNYFYFCLIVVTTLVLVLFIFDADFWMVLPSVFWLYFYSSLWAGTNNKH